MSQAEALLNSLTANVIDHKHEVPDSDKYFIIDPYTRQIESANYNKTVLMCGDHNSERFTFEIPRYVDGHDMSLCNRVIVHFDNVGYSIENVHSDVAYMEDLRINPDKPETVISSWLIRREATRMVGVLSFSLQYQCVEDGEITYEWNTDSYDEIEIRKSKNNGEAAVVNYTNVLEQWRSQIFGAGDSVMANITAEGATQVSAVQTESATQQAAIELKGSETLASIPEDYTDVYNMANEAIRTKADGIVCEAEDSPIIINDSSDDYIRGLNVYGKTTQLTTTGTNLLDLNNKALVDGGHYSLEPDGSIKQIVVDSRAIEDVPVSQTLPAGTYTAFIETFVTVDNNLHLQMYNATAGEQIFVHNTNEPVTFTLTEDADIAFKLYTSKHDACGKIQINAGNTALPWEPYTGGSPSPNPDYPQEIVGVESPTVSVFGKNLLDISTGLNDVLVDNKDGTYTITKLGEYKRFSNNISMAIPANTKFVFSYTALDGTCEQPIQIQIIFADGTNTTPPFGRWIAYDKDIVKARIYVSVSDAIGVYGTFKDPQLELSDTATAYEPYIAPQTITLANILHAIPVTTGANYIPGNYIDENGQEWICDEVDLERGVLIQRLYSRTFDGVDGETVARYAERENVYGFTLKFTDVNMEKLAHVAYCTHFENIVTGISSANKECFLCGAGSSTIYVLINKERLSEYSVEAFKTWLSENPITITFQLATPIETPLTAEEIETYKSLKTNYPNTTILNNKSTWMKAKYNADMKKYIDNAVETGVVNVVEGINNDTY